MAEDEGGVRLPAGDHREVLLRVQRNRPLFGSQGPFLDGHGTDHDLRRGIRRVIASVTGDRRGSHDDVVVQEKDDVPRAAAAPARWAIICPRFSVTTTRRRGSTASRPDSTSAVPSVLPSTTTTTSNVPGSASTESRTARTPSRLW